MTIYGGVLRDLLDKGGVAVQSQLLPPPSSSSLSSALLFLAPLVYIGALYYVFMAVSNPNENVRAAAALSDLWQTARR